MDDAKKIVDGALENHYKMIKQFKGMRFRRLLHAKFSLVAKLIPVFKQNLVSVLKAIFVSINGIVVAGDYVLFEIK